MDQFDVISGQYSAFVEQDPVRNKLHYPAVRKALGDVKSKMYLDVGCGSGAFDFQLASEGATVLAYDSAPAMITNAMKAQSANKLPVRFSVCDATSFQTRDRFHDALSVMVLPYAYDTQDLQPFFRSTKDTLRPDGRFISVVLNPRFDAFNKIVANRRFRKSKGNEVIVEFLDPRKKTKQFDATMRQFSQQEYETAARQGGFSKIVWQELKAVRSAMDNLGPRFWDTCEKEQPYSLLIAN